MKKHILTLLLCAVVGTSLAQYKGSKQPMIFGSQADLSNMLNQMDGQLAFVQDIKSTFAYDTASVSWIPLARTLVKTSFVTVNGNSVANTKIYTLEPFPGYKFYPTFINTRVVNITSGVTPPVLSIGTNASTYNNIASGGLLPTILSTVGIGNGAPSLVSASPGLSGGAEIYARVSTAAIGFTTYQIQIDISGYYLKQ